MHRPLDDESGEGAVLAERLDTLAAWLGELDTRVRTAELASGDEKTAKELRKAVEALAKHDPRFQERLTNHVDVLSDRVATLASTVSTATAAVAGKDGEIAGLRRELADANARIEILTAEVRTATSPRAELDELRRAIGQLASSRRSEVGDKRIEGMEDKLARLTQRLDTVSATVSTATSGIAGREGELAALRRRLDEDGARLGAAVSELRQTVDPAPVLELRDAVEVFSRQASALESETRRGLVALGVDVDGLGKRIEVVAASVRALAGTEVELTAVRQLLEQGDARAASLESGLARTSEELADLGEQLTALAATVAERDPGETAGAEVAGLAERFERGCAQVDALVRDLQQALETKPGTTSDPAVAERVESLAHDVARLAEEVAGGAAPGESDRLRALVEGLRMRLASMEQELSALAGSRQVVAGLDDLTSRVDALEGAGATPQGLVGALVPVAGDGRFRVELRALELRIEHAEAAARESREAVLTQIERLASRMEARLQRLESEPEPPAVPAQPTADGQVIPIRGEA